MDFDGCRWFRGFGASPRLLTRGQSQAADSRLGDGFRWVLMVSWILTDFVEWISMDVDGFMDFDGFR